MVNAVVLRPLPFPESYRLVSVQARSTQGGAPHPENLSYPQFFEYRKQHRVFIDRDGNPVLILLAVADEAEIRGFDLQ